MKKHLSLLKVISGGSLKAKKLSDNKIKKLLESSKKEDENPKELPCPACKSTNTLLNEKRNNNKVVGSGFRSWVVDRYYVCQECGTRFEDVSKFKK
jgi:C4-type Zn-finger protein